ncbi:hypothetical protein CPB84DRAFT_1850202 [Gymnopilus junonius]|uniref:Uncharacterized protein n=1 Tax=Gymnopilus junonius TaxID=109634 RepID=A0A9P5TKJ4_GYMJU|nr:hypothetical protein CPB84DRAFT_1850202 [Gymnopilus junonius]
MTDYESLYRSLLLGCFLSLVFFGLNTCQTLIYFRLHPSGPWKLKIFVIAIWVLEAIHTCFTAWIVYGVFVPRFGNDADAMAYATSGVFTTGLISVIITTFVQWFFAFRLYKLSAGEGSTTTTRIILSAIIPTLSAAFSLTRLVSYVGAAIYHALHHQTAGWKWCLFAVGILSIFSDLLMAVGLFVCLWKRWRSQKCLQERSHFAAMNRVFVIAIEANLFTWYTLSLSVYLQHLS